jgi:hypothetical protein
MKTDNCLELYFLQQEQKKFKDKIILQIDFEDTYSLHFNYYIPPYIQLFIRISIDVLTELVTPHLVGESADVFTLHFIALKVLSKELNVKNIGVCVSEEIENLVNEALQRKREQNNEWRKI